MKKIFLLLFAFAFAVIGAEGAAASAENVAAATEQAAPVGALLKSLGFESETEFSRWPGDSVAELDPEEFKEGKSSLVFTPDNNYAAYFFQNVIPGREYMITCWAKMDTEPIKRCGIGVNFAKAGGGNGSAGSVNFPLVELLPADNEWHQIKVNFKAPEGAVRAQVMLAMYRSNAVVFFDDFKLYDLSAKSVAQGTTVTEGKVIKALKFTSTRGLISDPKGKIVLGKAAENEGRDCMVFIPNNTKDCLAYTVYFYQRIFPGDYVVEFDFQAPAAPIDRAAFIMQFGGLGKNIGQLGSVTVKTKDFGTCDGSWQHAVIPVKVPAGVNNSRVMFAYYRTNVPIRIADFKIIKVASKENK